MTHSIFKGAKSFDFVKRLQAVDPTELKYGDLLFSAVIGEPLWTYMSGPDSENRLLVKVIETGRLLRCSTNAFRKAPLSVVDELPVYVGDIVYYKQPFSWYGMRVTGNNRRMGNAPNTLQGFVVERGASNFVVDDEVWALSESYSFNRPCVMKTVTKYVNIYEDMADVVKYLYDSVEEANAAYNVNTDRYKSKRIGVGTLTYEVME